jgi:pSer/pThr/pTyr-binding forkhead associated (FHA) protein
MRTVVGVVYCRQCGHQNPRGSRFCSSCGVALETSSEQTESFEGVVAPTVAPVATSVLLVTEGHSAGAQWRLEGDRVTAGRSGDSDVFLDDITVSRRHAELFRSEPGWVLRDVGSLNGTYVNGHRVDEALLANGDELQIGKFKLVFVERAQ